MKLRKLIRRLGLIVVGALFATCAFAQSINYHRVGGIVGEPDLFMVAGLDLFELAPNAALWVEAVTFTSFDAQRAFGGVGLRKDWKMATYTVMGGFAFVVPVGAGWGRIDDIGFGVDIGVRF